jgi:hypothetical protein
LSSCVYIGAFKVVFTQTKKHSPHWGWQFEKIGFLSILNHIAQGECQTQIAGQGSLTEGEEGSVHFTSLD